MEFCPIFSDCTNHSIQAGVQWWIVSDFSCVVNSAINCHYFRCQPLAGSDGVRAKGEEDLEYTEGTSSSTKAALLSVGGADLEVLPIVTSDDFWDGAYRLEREKRLKTEVALEKSKLDQKVMCLLCCVILVLPTQFRL